MRQPVQLLGCLYAFLIPAQRPQQQHSKMNDFYHCHHPAHERVHPAWHLTRDCLAICEFSSACGLCNMHFDTVTELRLHAVRSHGCTLLPRCSRQEMARHWPDFETEVTLLFVSLNDIRVFMFRLWKKGDALMFGDAVCSHHGPWPSMSPPYLPPLRPPSHLSFR